MEKAFRTLIVFSIILYIAYYFMPYIDHLWLNEDELGFLSNDGAKPIIVLPHIIWHLLFVSWVIIPVGLYFYIGIARKAFLLLVILTTLLTPFLGFSALSPLESFISSTSSMLDGALLIIIYFTSIGSKFEATAQKSDIRTDGSALSRCWSNNKT